MSTKILSLWITRKASDGEYPELIEAWDEYSVDGNWEGWDEAVKKGIASIGTDLDQYRIIELNVSYEAVQNAFTPHVLPAGVVTTGESPDAA